MGFGGLEVHILVHLPVAIWEPPLGAADVHFPLSLLALVARS
jgi:hypothetical protein